MLTREHRLTSSRAFSRAVRNGRRVGTRSLVVHLMVDAGVDRPQVGFVVSRAVGSAVTRNLVKRRLRHLARERVDMLPDTAVVAIRALPGAANVSFAALADDLDHALGQALGRSQRARRRGGVTV